jgi:hypothetical protein
MASSFLPPTDVFARWWSAEDNGAIIDLAGLDEPYDHLKVDSFDDAWGDNDDDDGGDSNNDTDSLDKI